LPNLLEEDEHEIFKISADYRQENMTQNGRNYKYLRTGHHSFD
jgi:hypothetical protein